MGKIKTFLFIVALILVVTWLLNSESSLFDWLRAKLDPLGVLREFIDRILKFLTGKGLENFVGANLWKTGFF